MRLYTKSNVEEDAETWGHGDTENQLEGDSDSPNWRITKSKIWWGMNLLTVTGRHRRLSASSLVRLCAWSLGIFLLCSSPTYAQSISSYLQQHDTSQQVLQELAKADVVYLGETHDSLKDHQAQLEILQQLYQRHSKMAIALEMFQRPYQNILDRYIAGHLSEQELLEQSEYNQRWGFPWEYYAPILQFAKEKQLQVLALNTPTEVTRKVSREGLESLTPEQRQFIPPFREIRTDNAEYRQLLLKTFNQHRQAGHSSASFERFFLTQVLWDETMAERIAQFLQANSGYQVVVLAGQGHIAYGYGIPSRVARRLPDRLLQRSVLFSPSGDVATPEKSIADFIWQQPISD